MPSSAWKTRTEDWLAWIDGDAKAEHPVWVSCDEFDEDLRTMLERFPFLGGLDTTSVSIVPGPMKGERAPDPGFDSMTTMIRQSPLHDDVVPRDASDDEDEDDASEDQPEDDDEATMDSPMEAAQTMVRGRVVDDSQELEIGIAAPEAGLEIGLEAPPGGEVEGLFIPHLTRTPSDAPSRTGDTMPPAGSNGGATPRASEPSGPLPTTGTVVQASPRRATDSGTVIAADAPSAADVIAYARQYGYTPPAAGDANATRPYAPDTYPNEPATPDAYPSGGNDTPRTAFEARYAEPGARTGTGTAPGTTTVASPNTVSSPGTGPNVSTVASPGGAMDYAATTGTVVAPGPGSRSGTAPGPPPPPPFGQTVDRTVIVESTMDTPPAIDLASARAQAYDDDDADADAEDDVAAERSAASSQTAGVIVTGFDVEEEQLGSGAIEAVFDDEESPAPRKIVVDASATATRPTAEEELDTVDIIDSDAPPPSAAVAEPVAAPPPTAPEPQQARKEPAPTSPAKGPPAVPPTPKGPPPAPKAVRKSGSETSAALAQLHADRDGSQAAAFERPAKEAGPLAGGWFEGAFADHYAALTRPSHGPEAVAEVDFFLQSTGLQPGATVLDVGCGDGAHAILLAQRGYAVTGIDNSMAQLLRATQGNESVGAHARFVQGDMREPPVDGPFDGIICFGTTLGYFDEDDNRRVIRKLRDRMSPGGRLLIQVFNRDHVVARLPARSWWQGHGCLVLDEAHMNYFTNRLQVHRTAVFEDGRQFEHEISVRAYSAHDLGGTCVDAGLRVLEISGSRLTRGRFYGATSPEIWLLALRP